jgi:hypothetical protein
VPAGSFVMGSPANEVGRGVNEGPQRKVTIRQPFNAFGYTTHMATHWSGSKIAIKITTMRHRRTVRH